MIYISARDSNSYKLVLISINYSNKIYLEK